MSSTVLCTDKELSHELAEFARTDTSAGKQLGNVAHDFELEVNELNAEQNQQ